MKVVLSSLLLLVASVASGGQLIDDVADGIPGSYIVTLDASHPAAEHIPAFAAAYGAQVAHIYQHAINGGAIQGLSRVQARALAQHPGVLRVEQDGVVTAVAVQSNPPSWGLDRVDQRNLPLDNAYNYDFDGTAIDVYIIDTGARATHNDFGGRMTLDFDSVGDGQNGNDCRGHGTHVSGTAGGTSYGVAKNVRLHAVRVLNCSGSGTFAGVIAGVDFVTQEAQGNPGGLFVANMSLGGGLNTSLNDAVDASVQAGVFYAVAAGNESTDACTRSPASAPLAYTVGATDINDNRASFSNYGTCVDIFGPGVSITSAWIGSDTATNTISGTSMASPHVAGAAALIRQEFPGFSPADVAAELTARATPGVVGNPGAGSPNLLLYTLGDGGGCTITENPEVSCNDGLDNDCDGLIDGDDPDCGGGCTITENPEVSCNDGLDNDCDGLIDGNDPDCMGGCLLKGSSCNSNADCCSGKCRGGNPTCVGNP